MTARIWPCALSLKSKDARWSCIEIRLLYEHKPQIAMSKGTRPRGTTDELSPPGYSPFRYDGTDPSESGPSQSALQAKRRHSVQKNLIYIDFCLASVVLKHRTQRHLSSRASPVGSVELNSCAGDLGLATDR
jgi:hypothetical protein